MTASFPYEFDVRFAAVWALLRLVPGLQGVSLTDDRRLVARYGPFRVETSLANVADAHSTGPFRWWTAVGARLSLADDGLTFGTTNHGGVCIHFHHPIGPVLGPRTHSALTVTVADRPGLVRALSAPVPEDEPHADLDGPR